MTRADIPDDLAAALHTAARGVPAYAGDLAVVRARERALRRRRTGVVAGGAALALAAVVGVPFAVVGLGGAADPQPDALPPLVEPAAPAAPAVPFEAAQRLLLDGGGWVAVEGDDGEDLDRPAGARESYEWYQQQPGASGVLGPLGEVRPDGEVVELATDLPGVDGINSMVDAGDGRFAAIGYVDLMPGVSRQDGPCVEELELRLLIIQTDGATSLSRNVRTMCETVHLLAADADRAYLLRDESRLVAHDLATGAERVLTEAAEVLGPEPARLALGAGRLVRVDSTQAGAACVAGDRAVGMSLTTAEVETGSTATHHVPGEGCLHSTGKLRISPDGRHVAVGYDRILEGGDDGGRSELRVAVVDLETGETVTDQVIADREQQVRGGPGGGRAKVFIAGLAFDDDRTLRVAWYRYPGQGMHWLPDLIEVETVSIG